MNSLTTGQIIITSSLTHGGAICKPAGVLIIATWKTTIWRILIDSSKISNDPPLTNKEIAEARDIAIRNKQQAVIATIFPDGHVEYRDVENKKTMRPRCIVKAAKTGTFKKELYEQS